MDIEMNGFNQMAASVDIDVCADWMCFDIKFLFTSVEMSLEACAHNPVKSQFVFNINVINSMLSLSYGVMNQQQKKQRDWENIGTVP